MFDRYYTSEEKARILKRAMRPSSFADMTPEQREEYLLELEIEKKFKHDYLKVFIFMFIVIPMVIATLL